MSRAKKDTPPRFPDFRDAFLELMGDMTLDQFSKKLEMSRATVGFYAAGQRIPDALGLKKIAEKCNVSADWLLGLSKTKSTDIDVQKICKKTGLSEWATNVLLSFGEETNVINELFRWPGVIHLLRRLRDMKHCNTGIEIIAEQTLPIFDGIASFDSYKNSSALYNAAAATFFTILKLRNDTRIMRFNVIDSFTGFVDELCDSPNYKKWEQQFNKVEKDSKLMHLIDDKIKAFGGNKMEMLELLDEVQSYIADLNDSLT